jgi:DNA-binding LacI/PurR family transcriptional regulator
MDALTKHQLEFDPELVKHSSLSESDIVQQVKSLLELPTPPDALFAIHDPAAIQAMLVIKEKGLRIPDDIALVGFNNEPVTALVEPSLTTIAQPAYQIGQLAARHILEQINKPEEFIPQKIVLKTELVVRNSSRRKNSYA